MRIVILGAGHLAIRLPSFSPMSSMMWLSPILMKKVIQVRNSLDVLTITANGTSPDFTRDPIYGCICFRGGDRNG